jgi:hypothetical protein
MKIPRISCLSFVAILAACSQATAKLPQSQIAEKAPQTIISSVTMHRSGCYGTCPIYKVTVSANGSVEFDGERHVLVFGKSKGSISRVDYGYLLQSIDRLQFSNWNEQYRFEKNGCKSVWTDNPTVDIVVRAGDRKKHVSYYYGCRGFALAPKIDLLSKIIDDVAGTVQWVGPEE